MAKFFIKITKFTFSFFFSRFSEFFFYFLSGEISLKTKTLTLLTFRGKKEAHVSIFGSGTFTLWACPTNNSIEFQQRTLSVLRSSDDGLCQVFWLLMNSFEYLSDTATQYWSIHILQ